MFSKKELWAEELDRISKRVLRKICQTRWTERSIFVLEKDLFVGFFLVRKLIENELSGIQPNNKTFKVSFLPKNATFQELKSNKHPYDTSRFHSKELGLREICNQFIHSEEMYPLGGNGHFIGLFIASEYQRKKGIFLIDFFSVVEIFRLCAGKEGLVDIPK